MFFLIKNMDIRGANALSAYPVANGVSPLAVAGFVRALAINLGLNSTENLGFSVVHHSTKIRSEAGTKPIPLQKIGALLTCSSAGKSGSTDYASRSMSLALQPVIECDTKISVVIDFEDIEMVPESISNAVHLMRVAGGQIQSFDAVYAVESFDMAIKKAGAGYVYAERSDLLAVEPENRVKAFVDNLYPSFLPAEHPGKQARKDTPTKSASPWLVPFNLGWLPLTEFQCDPGSRHGVDHAYAEPLIGFVEMLPARKALQDGTPIIWKTKKLNTAYVVSTSF